MRIGFYPRLAWEGIRKNKRLYVPYFITCVCMVCIHYILRFLSSPGCIALLPRGAQTTGVILELGSYVVLLFSLIFLYYTNSFLIRRRRKEFGLYNVLGMGKGNLARISSWESLFTALIALALGLALGVFFSKGAELILMNMMDGEIRFNLAIDGRALRNTAISYAVIFALIWLASLIRVRRSSAMTMLQSENVGEKPPKSNWLLGLLGLALLAGAYYLAVSISNPLDAVVWFFVAVLMVILATYMIMVAGSVLLCRTLQRNKRYYYQPRHFVSVSSMVYRMKRNGAGLASICIIATMVLVMLSSSSCLFFGAEDAIAFNYPRQLNLDLQANSIEQISDDNLELFRTATSVLLREQGIEAENVRDARYVNLTGMLRGTEVQCDYEMVDTTLFYGDTRDLFFMSLEDFNAVSGEKISLEPGEVFLRTEGCSYKEDSLTVVMEDVSHSFRIVGRDKSEPHGVLPAMTIVVPNLEEAISGFKPVDSEGHRVIQMRWEYGFDTGLETDEAQIELCRAWESYLSYLEFGEGQGYRALMTSSRAEYRDGYYNANGSLFFIGIMLSIVFLFAAVLIIYYKQISEGFEDQARFDIMQKVGMTKRDIRKSINSQLLTVFFLPLIFAGIHLIFAFPMIRKILTLFALYNLKLFLSTSIISFALFALLYTVIYKVTSNAYYAIVSGTKAEV